jgi:5-formyltetrahydrofolate cyclo-ligase
MPSDTQAIRTAMKRRRRALDAKTVQQASLKISAKLWKLPAMRRAKRIAIYMSVAGEIDCQPIIKTAELRKLRIFAPILTRKKLIFAPLKSTTPMVANRYQVLEPVYSRMTCVTPRDLDVVIVPLVAFDKKGNRLGMGGGFYDRSFAFTRLRRKYHRPLLIGVAYDFQRVADLQPQPWDVPLDVVITEKESYGSR